MKAFYAVDSSGRGRHGRYLNVTSGNSNLPGSPAHAVFDGDANTYIELPNANTLGTSFSLSLYFNRDNVTTDHAEILFEQPAERGVRVQFRILGRRLEVEVSGQTFRTDIQVRNQADHHLFAIVTTSNVTLYFDGRKAGGLTANLPAASVGACRAGQYFQGSMNELTILPVINDLDVPHYLDFIARGQDPRRINYAQMLPELSSDRIEITGQELRNFSGVPGTAKCDGVLERNSNFSLQVTSGYSATLGLCTDSFDVAGPALGEQPDSIGYRQGGTIQWTDSAGNTTSWQVQTIGSNDIVRFTINSANAIEIFVGTFSVWVSEANIATQFTPALTLLNGVARFNSGQEHFNHTSILQGVYASVDTPLTSETHYQKNGVCIPFNEAGGDTLSTTTGQMFGAYEGVINFRQPSNTTNEKDVSIKLENSGRVHVNLPEIANTLLVSLCFNPESTQSGTLFDLGGLKLGIQDRHLVVTGSGVDFQYGFQTQADTNYAVTLKAQSGILTVLLAGEILHETPITLDISGQQATIGTDQAGSDWFAGRMSHFTVSTEALPEWKWLRRVNYLPEGVLIPPVSDDEEVVLLPYALPTKDNTNFLLGAQ